MPARPALADGTMLLDDGVEQDEAEDAVQVEKDEKQNDRKHDYRGNQRAELGDARWIDVWERRRQEFFGARLPVGHGKIDAVEIATGGVNLGCEEPNQRQSCPLADAKRPEELVSGVCERGLDAIDGRDGQSVTSR